ncbi:DUF362 domain-containing protein [Phocaeicola faecium]|uniref:DUF362 domain-containing protein n=1 Tax=Phocaeicola faecium TaxID=2762213 RepID=A0ABR8V894_9BACT|nr:DUF362 domain-containing protein [Phocaeicola faecium]MBD8000993.1 DUF362 domain-containing protein [Phocaeicola faecium]
MKRMNRREWLKWMAASLTSSAVLPTFLTACGEDNEPLPEPAPGEEPDNDEPTGPASQVWMTTDLSAAGLLAVYHAVGRQATGRVAVKISTGEPGGHHYLQPSLIADLVHEVNGTIVECNTAYQGGRSDSTSHWQAIRDHGFLDIANVDLMDEEGEMQLPVQDTTHIQYNLVGSHLANYDFLINLTHFKGHAIAGFGGVLKNQSIGIASRRGKTNIHSAGRTQDVSRLWNTMASQNDFTESMAAAAQSVAEYFGDRILYINVMNNLSVDCDCDSNPAAPEMQDIGILASTAPVALEQACLDLVYAVTPTDGNNNRPLIQRIESRSGVHVVEYAERIGLGSRNYEVIQI